MSRLRPPAERRTPRIAGFTLIEIIIVMAITSLLATIAFIGQSTLRDRASFDSAVDKTIQNIAYARNYAMSNVNLEGGGNDTSAELVGIGIELDISHMPAYPLEEIEPLYAPPDAQGYPDLTNIQNCPPDEDSAGVCTCPAADHPDDTSECWEQFFSLGDDLTLSDPGVNEVEIDYVNTSQGLEVCHDIGPSFSSIQAACAASRSTPLTFDVTDSAGLSAKLQIDPTSGFAKRLN